MTHFDFTQLFSTYSIIARDPESGQLGGAVQTHQMAVGRIIPVALPGVGVVASQSLANISYNAIALQMLQEGIAPQQIINGLTASDPGMKRRQVAVINRKGEAAAFSGEGCIREFGHYVGENYSVQANMMTRPTVIEAMKTAFEGGAGDLAARMLAALQAAQGEDGDIRGMQSAALKVVPGTKAGPDWETIYDLRVDEHENPVAELARLAHIRRAQLVNAEGDKLLNEDKVEEALAKWQQAREMAPRQEELAFWQAVSLADKNPVSDAVTQAAAIFNTALAAHERRDHWLDLIGRLGECGIMQREGSDAELLDAIKENVS